MRIAGKRHGVKDLTGFIVGSITVVSYAGIKSRNSHWLCRCECGAELIVGAPNLNSGRTKSCGCKKAGAIALARTVHGATPRGRHDPAYHCWVLMRGRCNNPKSNRYPLYGGRGIKVCDRWLVGEAGLHPFECFLQDLGPRPSKAHTVDREDPDKDYTPVNCRWATPTGQARNKRNNLKIEWRGKTRALSEICEMEGVDYRRTRDRISGGWTIQQALLGDKA